MIISREFEYVFVELPRTGSTAIRKELISQYGGEAILHKHSTLREFERIATAAERDYFVFSCIRNPLDDAVSHYFKLHTDHHGRFTDPIRRKYRVGNVGSEIFRETGHNRRGERPRRRSWPERADNRKFRYIRSHDASFSEFFRRYHWLPYDNWSRLSHSGLDFVIRFENLQEDFATALSKIGLTQTRPLPVINKTDGKPDDYLSHYTPDIIPRARRIYGPYMRRWGYELPDDWGQPSRPRWEDAAFAALAAPRTLYWRYLRQFPA